MHRNADTNVDADAAHHVANNYWIVRSAQQALAAANTAALMTMHAHGSILEDADSAANVNLHL